eukprot:TRINITY_DN2708_c0_g1_i1.p1 TRINITY_DN2708_c0_g1~~TRINITY_DN2708_c0_g1_i1.p1  ORF type:complete len:270 (+),score=94.95 TRINITY_DN2708_c0_g1_i1:150-959(+)
MCIRDRYQRRVRGESVAMASAEISEHQRGKLQELYNWYDLDNSGFIDSAEELKQLACNTMCKMSPENIADPDLVLRFVERHADEAESHGGIDFERFVSIVVPALHIPERTQEELEIDQANYEIMALCTARSDIVIMEHANPELEGKVHKFMVLINIHNKDVRGLPWDECEQEIMTLAKHQRPLTMVFTDADGHNAVSHTFVEEGSLRMRWADRLKIMNDEIQLLNDKMLSSPRASPIKTRLKDDLEALNAAVDAVHKKAQHRRADRNKV